MLIVLMALGSIISTQKNILEKTSSEKVLKMRRLTERGDFRSFKSFKSFFEIFDLRFVGSASQWGIQTY